MIPLLERAEAVEVVNLSERFTEFFRSFKDEKGEYKYRQRIARMALEGSVSLVVDFDDILLFDTILAEKIIEEPNLVIKVASDALKDVMKIENAEYASRFTEFFVRIRKLPDSLKVPVRRIRATHLGKLIAIEGIVTKISPVKQLLKEAVFKCKECGEEIAVPQKGEGLEKPSYCPGCGGEGDKRRRGDFELLLEKSKFVDWQKFVLQERPEELPSGQLPRSIEVVATYDLVDVVRPGDRAIVTGVLTVAPERSVKGQPPIFQMFLEANNIEVASKESLDVEITPEDEKKILELSRRPDARELLISSIAPSIYGYKEIKKAIALLLFGGVPKLHPDGVRVRGDIHILLIGDPGTAKSQMLRYVASIAPRGVYTSGKGSTAAGLTAAVIREKSSGDFFLEAGALVLADGGIACLHPASLVSVREGEVEIEKLFNRGTAFEAVSKGDLVEISLLDEVEVASFSGGRIGLAKAAVARRKWWEGKLLEMRLENGRSLLVTPDHLILDAESWKWVEAETLSTGRSVVAVGENGAVRAMITSVREEEYEGYVYDLYVPGAHNFIAEGIVVHNCIDEFDKMDPKDRVSIHEAMEQQTVSIAKAGIVATLNARASVLAAANPAFGRYLHGRPVTENIDLPPTILSRFDLIFVITDVPNVERDRALAEYVVDFHRQYYPESLEHVIPRELLKKYIAYARKYVKPKLTDEAKNKLVNFYVEMRSRSQGADSPIAITPRQLEALIRLAEAHAKMTLSDIVTAEDAEAAIELMMHFLKSVGYDVETKSIDIDIVMTGQPKSQRDKILIVVDLLRKMIEESGGEAIKRDEFIGKAVEKGLDEQFVRKVLERLYDSGEIIEPKPGYILLLRTR